MNKLENTISYRRALNCIAHLEKFTTAKKLVKLDAFDRSLILAIMFDMDKNECLDDIVDRRSYK